MALEVVGLSYDSETLTRADLRWWGQIVSGLHDGLETRGSETTIPKSPGVIARTRRRHMRHVVLSILIQGDWAMGLEAARADARNAQLELEELFDPTRSAADLVATLENGELATLLCRPDPPSFAQLVPEEPTIVTMSVELATTSNPDWVYST